MDLSEKGYVVVVQCDQVVQKTCAGAFCEHAFTEREGGFARYPGEQALRYIAVSCGGCTGRAVLRKLMNVKKVLTKYEKRDPASTVIVHLSTCITRSSHHGPRCPHIDAIKGQIARAGLDCVEDTRISAKAEKRRQEGWYAE